MPSPFPGIYPFLEMPDEFSTLHDAMIGHMQETLQPRLPDLYFAKIDERVWIDTTQRWIEPDVPVRRSPIGAPCHQRRELPSLRRRSRLSSPFRMTSTESRFWKSTRNAKRKIVWYAALRS